MAKQTNTLSAVALPEVPETKYPRRSILQAANISANTMMMISPTHPLHPSGKNLAGPFLKLIARAVPAEKTETNQLIPKLDELNISLTGLVSMLQSLPYSWANITLLTTNCEKKQLLYYIIT